MYRARLIHILVLLSLFACLAVPTPVTAQQPDPLTPTPLMQSVTVSAVGGSWFGSNLIINGDAEVNGPGRPTSGWSVNGLADFEIMLPLVIGGGSTTPVPTAPAAPTNLVATGDSPTTMLLTWEDKAANETGYLVERAPCGTTTFAEVARLAKDSITFADKNLAPQTTYTYRVRAYNEAGSSAAITANGTTPADVQLNLLIVTNNADHPIVYLNVDGTNHFPAYPMGILPGDFYQMSLPPGHHTVEIRTGFWQDQTHRFDMYIYTYAFDVTNGEEVPIIVENIPLEDLLTMFESDGEGYWEGFYFDANSICRTAAFRFYENGTYKFYVSNTQQGTGTYLLKERLPDVFSLKFTLEDGLEGLLLEQYGQFYMNNGPANWQQITYVYKPQGYVHNPFCP